MTGAAIRAAEQTRYQQPCNLKKSKRRSPPFGGTNTHEITQTDNAHE